MNAALCLLALVGAAAASPQVFLHAEDDGQWKPHLDGSVLGSGAIQWGLEDGSWKPDFDGSVLGSGDLTWLSRRRRDIHPLDEPITAYAKHAQLIQQATEGTRNILGGGIPLHLPADTPEVAAGKQAHAIAHENQKALTAGHHYFAAAPAFAHHIAAPVAAPIAARIATPYAPLAYSNLGYSGYYGYGYPYAGVHALW